MTTDMLPKIGITETGQSETTTGTGCAGNRQPESGGGEVGPVSHDNVGGLAT